eukprot:1394865-Amorphochlora_amoeboformis.AAC.1
MGRSESKLERPPHEKPDRYHLQGSIYCLLSTRFSLLPTFALTARFAVRLGLGLGLGLGLELGLGLGLEAPSEYSTVDVLVDRLDII